MTFLFFSKEFRNNIAFNNKINTIIQTMTMTIVTLLFDMLFCTYFPWKYCYINEKSIPIRMLIDMLIRMLLSVFPRKRNYLV